MLREIVTVTLNPTIDRVMEVPQFRVGGHLPGRVRSRIPSGKAFNVSQALGLLGVRSIAAGWMGRDALEFFEKAARTRGVMPRFLPIDAPTRENITILDPKRRVETHIRDIGPTIAAADVDRLVHELSVLAHPNADIVFSGSTPPGVSPEKFGEMVDLCIGRGARVAIDTSRQPLCAAARRPIWLIKPNLLELTEVAGRELRGEAAILEAARQLNASIPIVIVTLGEQGAYCLAEGKALYGRVVLPEDRVRSTVGCGDAFMAGFLAEICAANGTLESAFLKALAVAAASAMNEQPTMFAADDVQAAARQVKVQPV